MILKWFNNPLNGDLIAKWVVRFIIFIGGIIILNALYNNYNATREVYENRAFTEGVILDYSLVPRSGTYSVVFKYHIDNKLYINNDGIDRMSCENCIGLKYRVIYSKKNPEKSFLLATKKSFERFDIEIPDEMEIKK